MHHFRDIIATIIPSISGIYTSLQLTNTLLQILVGLLTTVWLGYRVVLIRREYKSNKHESES